ncbi:rhodanese-like domain-containing protein [Pseudalkalibacillus sp. SCS-8]|uniref:rhodanese-like domain-containing protein n=1 Tax=Pseudalkalibacillus nanhaiensis TaxID=3115291 RepID=UPI0032DAFA6D
MVKTIEPKKVEEKLANSEKLSIIDVRKDEEVAKGMIPGAAHIPLDEIPERFNEIPKDEEHVMVCRSGGRSGKAAQFLQEKGYSVLNMSGGMLEWNGQTEPKK